MLKKKLISMALAAALVFSMLPVNVFAEASDGAEAEVTAAADEAAPDAVTDEAAPDKVAPAAVTNETATTAASDEAAPVAEEKEKEAIADAPEADKKDLSEEAEDDEFVFDEEAALDFDAFERATSIQSDTEEVVDPKHFFFNLYMFDDEQGNALSRDAKVFNYTFEGETYQFYNLETLRQSILQQNAKGRTVTIQLMLRANQNGLAYAEAPTTPSGQDTKYYQPDFQDPVKSKKLRAYLDYLAKTYSTKECHVDQWIMGNEVNMPSQWNWAGTKDPDLIVSRYVSAYTALYDTVRKYTTKSRVSLCVDHSWQNNDEGRGVPVKDFLEKFNAQVGNRTWCVAYHIYPAIDSEPEIWADMSASANRKLNPNSDAAEFVDGGNLHIMTNYIRSHFGSQHRVMMTEQGVTAAKGREIQAACLAISYLACKYNNMVDCYIYQGHGGYALDGYSKDMWLKLDSNDPGDKAWIESEIARITGKGSLTEFIPTYGKQVDEAKVTAFVTRLYQLCLGRDPDANGLNDWVGQLTSGSKTGAEVAAGFFLSDEIKKQNLSDEQYVETLYQVMMGRASDAGGKADWVKKLKECVGRDGVYLGFANSTEFKNICNSYGISAGSFTPSAYRSKNPNLTQFVYRMYAKALGREAEVAGVEYWCQQIIEGGYTLDEMATRGFFDSTEFKNKGLNDEQYVEVLYQTFFDRASDAGGKADWLNRMHNQNYSRTDVLNGFCGSREFANLKASFGL